MQQLVVYQMNEYELELFDAQKRKICLQRMAHGYLCHGSEPQIPPRVVKNGNLDAQSQSCLVDWFKLCPGSICIDAGGFIGDTAYALSERGCIVHTFEPFLEHYLAMLWNMRGRSNVTCYFSALGNGERVALNYDYEDSDTGMLCVVDSPKGVRTRKLDEFMPWPHVELLKIDCEGREIRVLQGASKLIARYRPILFVESFPTGLQRHGFTVEQLHNQIRGMGYTIQEDTTDYVSTKDLICYPIP